MDIKAPPDPAAPLKLLQAGRADVVISYEPELLLARDKGADDLVAVGALVQKPLTSLIALPASQHHEREGPRGQARRDRRHRLPVRLPEDDPRQGGRRPRLGQGDERRLRPRPPADHQARRRDARRVLELRGRGPAAARQEAGDPAHGPARRAHLRRAGVRRPQARTSTRTAPRASAASCRRPRAGTRRSSRTRRRAWTRS